MKSIFRCCLAGWLSLMALGCADNNVAIDQDQLPRDHLPVQIEPLSYNIELYLQERKEEFTGHVEIDINVTQPFKRLWIHGAELKMGIVQVVGTTISNGEWRQHTPEGLASVVFDREVSVGRNKLIFDYSAPFSPALKGFIRAKEGNAYLLSTAEGGARFAIPGFDEPKFRAPINLSVNVPSHWQVVASSRQLNNTLLENDRHVVRFEETLPLSLGSVSMVVLSRKPVHEAVYKTASKASRVIGFGESLSVDTQTEIITQGLAAIENRSGSSYPFNTLQVVWEPSLKETVNAAGLIVNPPLQQELQAQLLAQHWLSLAAYYRDWTSQCVAQGIAKWSGIDAYVSADLLPDNQPDIEWLQAVKISSFPLGAMCVDAPSDKVLPLADKEDTALVAGALYIIENRLGSDLLAEKVWADWRQNTLTKRAVQDFFPEFYQQIFGLLQYGQLMPTRCDTPCRYTDSVLNETATVEQAMSFPGSLSMTQWRSLLGKPGIDDFLVTVQLASEALPPEDGIERYGAAWSMAFAQAARQDFNLWSGYLRQVSAEASSDKVRRAALWGLTESTDQRVALWFQQLLLNNALAPDESDALFLQLMQSPQSQLQFEWFVINRDKLMRKMPPYQRVRWLDALGELCGPNNAADVEQAMQPVAKLIYRGEARLQRALARINQCVSAQGNG